MNDVNKGRISYIDIAKFWGIFLLLVEHTGNWIQLAGHYNYLKIWICSFHMPLFFIVLGMVVSVKPIKSKDSLVKFIDKRVKGLIVLYIIWGLIYAPGIDLNFFKGILYGTNPSLGVAATNQVLWFLPAMFIAMLLFQLIVNINSAISVGNDKMVLVIYGIETLLLSILSVCTKQFRGNYGLPWGLDIAFMGCVFIICGLLLKEVVQRILANKWIVVVCFVICISIGITIALHNQPDDMWVTIMALAMYGHNWILFIIGAVCSTLAIVIVSWWLKNISILTWIGENSLLVMVVHYIIFPYTVKISANLMMGHDVLIALLNALLTIMVCIPIIIIVKHYAPILEGK